MTIVVNILLVILWLCLAIYTYNESRKYPVLSAVAIFAGCSLVQLAFNYMYTLG